MRELGPGNRRQRKVRVNTEKSQVRGEETRDGDPRVSSGAFRALAQVSVSKLQVQSLGEEVKRSRAAI